MAGDAWTAQTRKDRDEAQLAERRIARASELLGKRADPGQSIRLVDAALLTCPANLPLVMLRVQALVGVGRQAEALAASDALIKAGKNPPGMLYWRAQAMYNMDNMDGAVRHMQQAMRSDPDNGDYKTALKLFRKLAAGKEKGNTAFKAKEYVERHAALLLVLPPRPTP